jgi:hypothetical protein
MPIIWRGYGFLMPLIWLAGLLATYGLVGHQTYESHAWPKVLAGIVTAIAIGWTGATLNQNRPAGNKHTFFFMNMEAWAVVSLVIATWAAVRP